MLDAECCIDQFDIAMMGFTIIFTVQLGLKRHYGALGLHVYVPRSSHKHGVPVLIGAVQVSVQSSS